MEQVDILVGEEAQQDMELKSAFVPAIPWQPFLRLLFGDPKQSPGALPVPTSQPRLGQIWLHFVDGQEFTPLSHLSRAFMALRVALKDRSGVSEVHQWSVMLPTGARVAQEVNEPLIGIQYPMLCGCKNGRWQTGTGSIRHNEKKPTGLRFDGSIKTLVKQLGLIPFFSTSTDAMWA